jgi:hypothetical protein
MEQVETSIGTFAANLVKVSYMSLINAIFAGRLKLTSDLKTN